jgi:Domain of unknown function (DUF4111)/Nucleotidyltransferase domain
MLGRDLVGLYLHGSAAFGDHHPDRSDIDLLAVCAAPLADATRLAVAASLSAAALPAPAEGGLEFSLITRSAAADPAPAPAYELHGWDDRGLLHPDDGRGDPDLPLHFAVVRACGVVVLGPKPDEVFRDVPRDELLERLVSELDWADANASPSYRVLAACRALHVLEEGRICSKRTAAEWALARGEAPALVAAVLTHHVAATAATGLDAAAVAAFTADVRTRLRDAVAGASRPPQ